jgi:hypothetical protein
MTELAHEVYMHLLRVVRSNTRSVSYGELAVAVSKKHPTHPRSPTFHAALGEVTTACRARGLPCLPAIVWRARGKRPSSGYYAVAHPRARTEKGRLTAWQHEHAAVIGRAASYPGRL